MKEEKIGVKVIKAGSVPLAKDPETGLEIQRLVAEGTTTKVVLAGAEPGWSASWVCDFVEITHVLKGKITLYWADKKQTGNDVVAQIADHSLSRTLKSRQTDTRPVRAHHKIG